MPQPLSELICGTFLIYPSPRDTSEVAKNLRANILKVKTDGFLPSGERIIEYTVKRLVEEIPDTVLEELFVNAILVPVPTSKKHLPSDKGPQLWTPDLICDALLEQGLGAEKCRCIFRKDTIRSSKRCSTAEERPTPQEHVDTMMGVSPSLVTPDAPVLLVDDVATRGSTMLGAGAHVAAMLVDREIRGFAVAGTANSLIGNPVQPTLHRIIANENGCWRRPM